MPFTAITYDIKGGCEDEVAEVFDNFRRPSGNVVPGTDGAQAGRILATAVFIRDSTLVRFIEYEGDLDAVIRFMAAQPGVSEVERKLAPYLNNPRDTGTVDGFLRTFRASQLRCITQFAVPRQPGASASAADQ
ncbi:SchA/CurD [Nonomuraea sp. MG754425]|uniref:SchA/CurD-like domain-containing protein n=1 Tax=Nonomuraea sp. MG754425 TaxID=2570319 RepID=UPI001F449DE0|nr:SchA/CurD-like domain-containing protein [Nonomuraea sp. MG754425]MCF6470013.1 SchA/CurD [Nonomuraea sp. MG754425]